MQNGTGQTPLHMSISYAYESVVKYLYNNGANDSIKNWDGHQAKNGIEGDKDRSGPLHLLETCVPSEAALSALVALEALVKDRPDAVDKGQVAMLGMQVKKGNRDLPKDLWTPECQAKFGDVMKAL